jgi:hypothetical protein
LVWLRFPCESIQPDEKLYATPLKVCGSKTVVMTSAPSRTATRSPTNNASWPSYCEMTDE